MFLKKKWIKYLPNVLFFSKYYNKKLMRLHRCDYIAAIEKTTFFYQLGRSLINTLK